MLILVEGHRDLFVSSKHPLRWDSRWQMSLSLGTMALLLIITHLGRAGLFSMLVVLFHKHHGQVVSGPAEPKLPGHTKPTDIHSESRLVSEKAVLKH